MAEDLYIDINNKLLPHEDYSYLRSEGIKLIEQLSGKIWTNYNTHDPGITILEALCYALTELGYKTSFNIADLLAPNTRSTDWSNIFFTAKQILTSNPVSITDYRKLIIDTEGVRNAWIEVTSDYEILLYLNKDKEKDTESGKFYLSYTPESGNEPLRLRGLYKITVEYEDDIIAENKQEFINAVIRKKLSFHRNLCEDFLTIRPVNYELFRMEAEVKVSEGSDIERINAKIFQVIHNFFSPSVKFYTLQQMLEKGYSTSEIFEGPSLKNGFIDTRELEQSERYMDIHLSDIINLIMDIPGVIAVKKCVFPIETQSAFSDFTQWITDIKEKEKAPRLDIENSVITFFRSGDRHRSDLEKQPDKQRVRNIYFFLQSEVQSSKLKGVQTDIAVPNGENMDVAVYFPFQYSLPAAYGMHEKIFGATHPDEQSDLSSRENQILQLRGYLMIFEQIMSDYLYHLSNIRQLFSFSQTINQSFFPRPLEGIYDIEHLFVDYQKYKDDLIKLTETDKHFLRQRNAMLNHLLARLGEDGEAYFSPDKRNPVEEKDIKVSILTDYIAISSYRGSGYNYSDTDKIWDTDNVAGMKRRIGRLLGFKSFNTTAITSDWITIEKVQKQGNLTRFKIVLHDPENSANILLESNEYEHESEIHEILKYILQSGSERSLYDIDARRGKKSFSLKKPNNEGSFDIVAVRNLIDEDPETYLTKTIETLEILTGRENFHILEHILLRPRINPQDTGTRRTPGRIEATTLLSIPAIPENDFIISRQSSAVAYTFKKTRIKDPAPSDKVIWKLSLKKEDNEILVSTEDFIFEGHIRKREERIRQLGTDDTNYIREKNSEGRFIFRLADRSKEPPQILAICKKSYQKEEDMEAEIKSLIRFFSFEMEIVEMEDIRPDLNSFADPYSFRISMFIPAWPAKFRDPGFRHLFEKAVYLETPAHIYPEVYWLEYHEMKDFEEVYKAWLHEIAVNAIPDYQIVNNLVDVVNRTRIANDNAD
ncbi:MAG TPA: hypothetical protein VHI78_12865 [Bacteroidales bacterium]|nr:hypothetical protein [Bacteroidales bacterium]